MSAMQQLILTCPKGLETLLLEEAQSLGLQEARSQTAAVRGEGPVLVSAEDGLSAVAIGTAAEISALEHRVVEMAEIG